ncbi:50S ribosomal protein L25 [Patescibacteria group bacterium]|nr:50S ribosomal protein L25 [Patescibacteria group bacterium]MBU1921931.1 50S ribosomal protein L25 [Patescibacteria group bacterium]
MQTHSLEVKERKISGKKVNQLRRQGLVPGIVYGHGVKNVNIAVRQDILEKIYKQAGESSLIDLKIEDKKSVKVLIQDIQREPVRDNPLHVDFRQIRMDEKLITEIPLKFEGEAAAVKEHGGTLVKNFDSLEVECLPKDLVHEIIVDLGSLKTFDDSIRVKDLNIPEGMRVLQDVERSVAVVLAPLSEEELAALEKAPESGVGEVEVVGEEKKEGEEAEEDGEKKKEAGEKGEKKDEKQKK